MSWAEPDEVRDHYPSGVCACGADLSGAEDLGVARSLQQLAIPGPAAQRIQHDLHWARCGCGREHVAPRPPGTPDAAVPIGPNLRALAVYLVVFQHVPVERCRDLIADVTGARVSAGFIHSCLRKAAELAAGVVKLIKTLITAAHVAGFDETTLRCGPAGQKKYVHGPSPTSTRRSSSRSAPWSPCASSGSCRASPAWWSLTGTRTTSTSVGSTSPGTRRALRTWSGTSKGVSGRC